MRVECTNCRNDGETPPEFVGRIIKCKKCGMKFVAVDKPEEELPVAPPKPPRAAAATATALAKPVSVEAATLRVLFTLGKAFFVFVALCFIVGIVLFAFNAPSR